MPQTIVPALTGALVTHGVAVAVAVAVAVDVAVAVAVAVAVIGLPVASSEKSTI